jgi:SlyX protein
VSNDERLNLIEERIAWLERHVTAQDRAMLELGEENARLRKELAALRARVSTNAVQGDEEARSPEIERPPHY